MGNPLSPLLAEIFMNNLEETIHKSDLHNLFLYWYRYVDDILTCFIGTNRQLSKFLNFINNIHPNIKFTIEEEINNSINFLDLQISKINHKHEFSIFHKPSHTDITIHSSSTHPIQHKLAAFHSMVHRLLNIPMSPSNYLSELNIIKQIAVNNGFNPNIIDKLLIRKQFNLTLKSVYPLDVTKNNSKFKCLTYFGPPTEKVSAYLKKLGLNIAYRTNNSLGKILKNNKDKTDQNNKSGVYKLTCGSCPKIYIGQTGRNFKKRISEHKNSYIKNKTDSTYACHLIEEKHLFNDNFNILHVENKGQRLSLLECLEINKNKKTGNLLNDQIEINNSPLLNLF